MLPGHPAGWVQGSRAQGGWSRQPGAASAWCKSDGCCTSGSTAGSLSRLPPLPGLLLREAIEDLEWTGGEVEFVLRRSPMRFALRSVKQQSLEVRCRWAESKSGHWVVRHLSP